MVVKAEEERRGGWSLALAKLQIPALVLARYLNLHAKGQSWVQAANCLRRALLQGHVGESLHT